MGHPKYIQNWGDRLKDSFKDFARGMTDLEQLHTDTARLIVDIIGGIQDGDTILRANHRIPETYHLGKYRITQHGLVRYLERFLRVYDTYRRLDILIDKAIAYGKHYKKGKFDIYVWDHKKVVMSGKVLITIINTKDRNIRRESLSIYELEKIRRQYLGKRDN